MAEVSFDLIKMYLLSCTSPSCVNFSHFQLWLENYCMVSHQTWYMYRYFRRRLEEVLLSYGITVAQLVN